MRTSAIICYFLKRKVATAVLIAASLAAFATFGEGGRRNKDRCLTSNTVLPSAKNFSLKSNYHYRGSDVLGTAPHRYIMLNTNVTFQKGNNTYILPLKRKVLLDRVVFNPAPPKH